MTVSLLMRTGASHQLKPLPDYRRRESAHVSYLSRQGWCTRFLVDLMAVSRSLRFEILRRDQHCCRYCGEHASPEVKLTVDHVLPVALGGSDEPSNLAAACQPCNAGKAASNPEAPLVAQVSDDEIRWRRAMANAARKQQRRVKARNKYISQYLDLWNMWDDDHRYLPQDYQVIVRYWWSVEMPMDLIEEAMTIAVMRYNDRGLPGRSVHAYTIGVIKKMMAEMSQDAYASLTGGR